jgi:hypothetical protein
MQQLYPCAGALRTVFFWSPADLGKKCSEVVVVAGVPFFAARCPSIAVAWEGHRGRCAVAAAQPVGGGQWRVRRWQAIPVLTW